jgi:PAS domain S-box-containing protein
MTVDAMRSPRNHGPAAVPRKRRTGTSGSALRPSLPGADLRLEAVPPRRAAVSDELLRSAFDRSPTGMTVSAPDGRWLWVNDAYCRMLGYERAQLLEISHREVTHCDDVGADREFTAAALAGDRDVFEREKRYERADGSVVWARVRAEVIRDESREPLYFVSHVQDITDRREAQDLLHDSERTLRAVIDNTPAMISVKGRDHRYKLVNREFEQAFGMTADRIVGRRDADILPAATLADVHAKELAVLSGGRPSQEEQTTMRDGREQVALITRFPLLDETGVIHGVCTAATDITERRAEERYKRERLQCSELIYSALAENRFVLYGQPIVDLRSMTPSTAELLLRMRTTRGGTELAAPGTFLPAAERFDLISVIDEWVVDRAAKHAAAGHRVTVNVSARTISDSREVERIEATIIASGAPARNLTFEITETAVADDLNAARSFAIRMRRLGCAVALDDFGVGHGSFTYLRHLPIDYLKIDMQFVRDLLTDDEDQQVVQAIVGIAQQFGLETIAEGVDAKATLERLRDLGVDYAQGYFTGPPMPLADCWQLLTERETSHARTD